MPHTLLSWIGQNDLDAAAGVEDRAPGPLARAVEAERYDRIHLLCNYPKQAMHRYVRWLRRRTEAPVEATWTSLESPIHFGSIHEAATAAIESLRGPSGELPELTLHLSPGTPAMAAVWILLGKARYHARLIQASREGGVVEAVIPFDIAAEFLPDLYDRPDARLERLSAGLPGDEAGFEQILHRSREMRRVVALARRVAPRSVPVLIEGESGTGKELFARAIHAASARGLKPLVTVNCGAIPETLIESELFGYRKGAFTGADRDRDGLFKQADGGTLFLDEIGEMPASAQVRLLRVLGAGEVTPVGPGARPVRVDVRVIAATNRILAREVEVGRFREDLYYRLAVFPLRIPAVRERTGDLGVLIDGLLSRVNDELEEPGYEPKQLTAGARSVLMRQSWPGNVREILNTLTRAAILSSGASIAKPDVEDALAARGPQGDAGGVLDRALGHGFDLQDLIGEVVRHYLARAMRETHGNKTRAAELVGLPSYQTLTNWLERYEVEWEG